MENFASAVTKYHRLGGLTKQHVFLIVLEARNFKIKVLADILLGEGQFPVLQIDTFFLYPHMKKTETLLSLLLLRALIPSWELYPHNFI